MHKFNKDISFPKNLDFFLPPIRFQMNSRMMKGKENIRERNLYFFDCTNSGAKVGFKEHICCRHEPGLEFHTEEGR